MNSMTRSPHGLSTPCEDWWSSAACAGRDPKWWDLPHKTKHLNAGNRAALAVCSTCPVIASCDADTDPKRDGGQIRAGKLLWPTANPNGFPLQRRNPTTHPQCGTTYGTEIHRRAGELACEACRKARARRDRHDRERRRAADPRRKRCAVCDGHFPLNIAGNVHAHSSWWVDDDLPVDELCPGSREAPRRAVLLGEEG